MKTTKDIQDQITILSTELENIKDIKKKKEGTLIKSIEHRTLCERESEISIELSVLQKQLNSPIPFDRIKKDIETKTTYIQKLEIKKRRYEEPSKFLELLRQISRIKTEKSTLQWLID